MNILMKMASIVLDRTNPWVTLPGGPDLGMGLVDMDQGEQVGSPLQKNGMDK